MKELSALKDGILSEARQTMEAILEDAKKKAHKIIQDGKLAAALKRKEIMEEAGRKAEEEKKRILIAAELEIKKKLLSAKNQIIEQVFQEAYDKLLHMDTHEYQSWMADTLIKSAVTGRETVLIGKKEMKLNEDWLMEVNKKLKAMGKTGELKLGGEKLDMQGGFILHGNNTEVNNSLEVILSRQKSDVVPEIAKILFG